MKIKIMNIMNIIFLLLVTIGLTISIGCFSTYQSPKVLDPGERRLGVGFAFGKEKLRYKSGVWVENTYIFDGSIFYREGLGHNTDTGIKILGVPGDFGAILGDVKYQIIKRPLMISGSFGLAYWIKKDNNAYKSENGLSGLNFMLMFGNERVYSNLHWNFFKHYNLRGITLGTSFPMFGEKIRVNPEATYCYGHNMADMPYFIALGLGIQYCF